MFYTNINPEFVCVAGIQHAINKDSLQNCFPLLKPFVAELGDLFANGFAYRDVFYDVKLRTLVCDIPATALAKMIKSNGYASCQKCTVFGFMVPMNENDIDGDKRRSYSIDIHNTKVNEKLAQISIENASREAFSRETAGSPGSGSDGCEADTDEPSVPSAKRKKTLKKVTASENFVLEEVKLRTDLSFRQRLDPEHHSEHRSMFEG